MYVSGARGHRFVPGETPFTLCSELIHNVLLTFEKGYFITI